jgi:mono/diheme cytochrome c family protein
MRIFTTAFAALVVVLGIAASACSSEPGAPAAPGSGGSAIASPLAGGQAVYENRVEGANTFTCSTCHALREPTDDGLRRPGHPIGDATRRPNYKNGQVPRMLDAVNSCLTEWMNADAWTESDPRYTALHRWLDEQAGSGAAPALKIQRVDPPAVLTGGDAERGLATFNGACAVCHGANAEGTQKAPKVSGLGLGAGYVATRVRTSGRSNSKVYPGLTGGVMPFWGADRLSDAELVDIVAFLGRKDTSIPGPTTGGTNDSTRRVCGTTHARVGQTAVLQKRFHGVEGKARIVDDCTIEITEFAFDGGGIDVRVYGGKGGDYARGFAMGDDLRKPGGYSGATIRVSLPTTRTLDDLDGVSIWCVPAGADFGSGPFGL